ncbi:hypothetical protein BCR33DRAFT_817092 [Rhizoclosmatium globosum]|uniref:Uncharacterized protein n=1 Tax=Rhizoclosmatium globosum TaxID=329046 RepID=A0A1Y2AEP5_9FUNG|nr:hypothetical protein BCR33DRAFT_817092 [Rhizoclosmatium globosum]|eukprot:ORY21031.1 hypothetical protein BCR33DRAFT_817092 [Rhizoclosmatium globosum]
MILYSQEAGDTKVSRDLWEMLGYYDLVVYMDQCCGEGEDFDDDRLEPIPTTELDATEGLPTTVSKPLHPDDMVAMKKAKKAIIIMISAYSLSLMLRRLNAGVKDEFMESWKQAIALSKEDGRKLIVVYVPSGARSGHRITLTYNLFKTAPTQFLFTDLTPQDNLFYSHLKASIANPKFFENGAIFLFHCEHAYQIPANPDPSLRHPILHMLKGTDMQLFQSAVACDLQVFLKPVYGGFSNNEGPVYFVGNKFVHGGNSNQYEAKLDFLTNTLGGVQVKQSGDNVVWFGEAKNINLHEYMYYGNEASVEYVYSSAVLVVVIPAWKVRSGLIEE